MRLRWIRQQWNEPNRTDHYLMQIAAEIRAFAEGFRKNPRSVRIGNFKLEFGLGQGHAIKFTKEQFMARAAAAKSRWLRAAGLEQPRKPQQH